jgi:mannan endo-1,4-beta-mannosidase
MKRRIFWGLAVVSGLVASTFLAVQPAYAATGIRVVNGVLVEANDTPLKLRGINHLGTTSGGTATCAMVNEWPAASRARSP